ncbi:transferase [Petrotoga sp. 9PW.55.5.1]|uniref:citramalate synthase n=1 Tax=Petrotoga sp. 9PW.55.5.1 TaxID=1308979 RepID=UPI000DC51A11|nr:citramalate synthase [Petrotoga sp. 9PW.55.5.1]RAO98677.1 transferase [Petrotoga sp. 9PW.55.5.1]
MNTSKVKIFDTTLRDGTQGEGVSLTVKDKLKIAQKLDEYGIDYIEGGWPGSNPKDEEFFQEIKKISLKNSEIVAFSSTKRHGIKAQDDPNIVKLLYSGVKTVTIFAKSWDFHVTDALGISLDDNLKLIADTVSFLKKHGIEVFFDGEHFFDGFNHNPNYALKTLEVARDSGASIAILCDTNGGQTTKRMREIIKVVKEKLNMPLGIHAHNDSGLAVANSIIAFEEGIEQIQGTVGGLGERCGNADLCTIIPILKFKYDIDLPKINLEKTTHLYNYVMEVANITPDNRKPFVGRSAFTHKGGIHVSAILKNPLTYEHIAPELVGNERRILVSELAGKSNLKSKIEELGFSLSSFSDDQIKKLTLKIKEYEHDGYQFEGADASLKLLLLREFFDYNPDFQIENFNILSYNFGEGTTTDAAVKVRINDEMVHTVASGDGPVNALDKALRKALENHFPILRNMKLIDYKVRVLDSASGTAAKVRVLIETSDTEKSWTTVGVSTNIIQASWKALIDSIEYGLYANLPSKIENIYN